MADTSALKLVARLDCGLAFDGGFLFCPLSAEFIGAGELCRV